LTDKPGWCLLRERPDHNIHVSGYFAALPGFSLARCGKRVGVTILCANLLNKAAMKSLARLKNELQAQDRGNIIHAF
jgi:hypothetical protein